MQKVLVRWSVAALSLFLLVLPAFAGQLDEHYLAAFAPKVSGSALEKAILTPVTGAARAVRSGTPLKHALSRDWDKLETSTQKVLAKQLALPVLSGTEAPVVTSSGGHFRIHYTTIGSDQPDIVSINRYAHLGITSIADWATLVGNTFEAAYSFYQGLGYHMPPTVPYDVYLASLVSAGEYGETVDLSKMPSGSYPYASGSYITVDKDFTNSIFTPGRYSPLESLKVTSVHEFHHAVQYGYNYYFDVWYAEATSTWFEGELYPEIPQNYDYLAGWFSDSTRQLDLPQSDPSFNSEAYGRWLLNRHLAQKYTPVSVRKFWEAIAPIAPVNGADISMAPVINSVLSETYNSSLGAELLSFAKRIYTRDWPSTNAVTATDVSGDLSLIPTYAPVASYSSYPVNAASSAASAVTLPHYSFAYYKFTPPTSTAALTLTLEKASGIQAAVFLKVGGTVSEISPNADGTTYTVAGFGALDEVALLFVNTSTSDGLQASFSTDGSVRAASLTTSSGGSKSGCFIATAAYGSYLHPKVAELRAFRDNYLLTNAPGRLFVAFYYRVSPPLADLIARHSLLRGATRLLLAPVILAVEHGRAALLLMLICFACAVPVLGKVRGRWVARRGMVG
jgi:hypothetical protein